MSFPVLPDTIPCLKEEASNWATFAVHFRETMQAIHHWGHFDGTNTCPVPKDAAHPTNTESEAIKEWKREDVMVQGLLSLRLPDRIFIQLIDHKMAKGRWDRLIEEFGQPGYETTSKDEGLTGGSPATAEGSSQRRWRRREKCRPADATDTADIEGEGCSLAKEGDTHAQIVSAEAVLSQQHTQGPDPKVPAQTLSAEPEAILGEPGAIEEGAHAHDDHAEPDLKVGQPGDLNTNTPKGVAHGKPDSTPGEEIISNTPVHLEGTGPEVLMEEEVDRPLEVEEDGTTGKTVSVEGDIGPCVELREPGVSCLATQENTRSLTLPSPPLPTTPEAASMQRSLAIDIETPAIPVPDHGTDLEPQPHNTPPPPNEGAEPSTHQPPKQIRAPTEVEGPLPGEESQCAMGQRGPTSARKHEGKTPIGEAHGRPPDLPNLQRPCSIDWEPVFVIPKARVRMHKARRPVLGEGACTCPNPWPDLGAITVDPDIYFGSAS